MGCCRRISQAKNVVFQALHTSSDSLDGRIARRHMFNQDLLGDTDLAGIIGDLASRLDDN